MIRTERLFPPGTQNEAHKRALKKLLRPRPDGDHPFIGGDKGDGSDVSGSIKSALRVHFRARGR